MAGVLRVWSAGSSCTAIGQARARPGSSGPWPAISATRSERPRGQQGEPQPALGAEALLRCEVVDVGLGDVDRGRRRRPRCRRPPSARRRSRRHPPDRGDGAGRGLVVGPGVDVRVLDGGRHSHRARPAAVTTAGAARCGAAAAAAANLAENSPKLAWALRRPISETDRDVPEQRSTRRCPAPPHTRRAGRTARSRPALTSPTSRRTGACRCEVPSRLATRRGQRRHRLRPHLGRSAAEPPVAGQQVGGDHQRSVTAAPILQPVSGSDSGAARLAAMRGPASAERVDYVGEHLLESAAPAEPYALFQRWLSDAFAARDRGELAEPTAMVVATCDERPAAGTHGAAEGLRRRTDSPSSPTTTRARAPS